MFNVLHSRLARLAVVKRSYDAEHSDVMELAATEVMIRHGSCNKVGITCICTCLVYLFTAIKTAGEPKASPKLTGPKMLNRSNAFDLLKVNSSLQAV